MVEQIDRRQENHEIYHESAHSMLIFKIKNALPKLRVKSLALPDSENDKIKFKELVKGHINVGTGRKIDILYDCSQLKNYVIF